MGPVGHRRGDARRRRTLDEGGLRAHVRQTLAGYKTPKRIVIADRDLRAANGKADYPAAKASAAEQLA